MSVQLYELRFASDLLSLCTSSVFVFGFVFGFVFVFVLFEVYTRPHVTSYLFHCLSVFWLLRNQILLDLHHLGDRAVNTGFLQKGTHSCQPDFLTKDLFSVVDISKSSLGLNVQ